MAEEQISYSCDPDGIRECRLLAMEDDVCRLPPIWNLQEKRFIRLMFKPPHRTKILPQHWQLQPKARHQPGRHLTQFLFLSLLLIPGCSRLKPKAMREYVYVVAKQTFLRDRVAAVSNRTATVENGDKLEVLERGRRFIRVETGKGEQGWIDEKVVAAQSVYDSFEQAKQEHKSDPAIASAVVRDEVYLHDKPGRETDRLFRLAEGDKLKLLVRAMLPKTNAGQGGRAIAAVSKPAKISKPGTVAGAKGGADAPAEGPPPPVMEDWWLVRDAEGRTGWMLSRMMDVDAPEALTRYSEGQRFVGAYVLNKINDSEAPMDDKDVPEFVTVSSPYKSGLPYDFDQVRVFIWNARKHRYETGFRQKNIEGYLPIEVLKVPDPYGKGPAASTPLPAFRIRVLAEDAPEVVPDALTGRVAPTKLITKTYRLEGNIVRRILPPDTTPEPEAHPIPETEKKRGRRRR